MNTQRALKFTVVATRDDRMLKIGQTLTLAQAAEFFEWNAAELVALGASAAECGQDGFWMKIERE